MVAAFSIPQIHPENHKQRQNLTNSQEGTDIGQTQKNQGLGGL